MAARLSGPNCNVLKFLLSLKEDLDTMKLTTNIEACTESIGAKLEYWYVERDPLKTAV